MAQNRTDFINRYGPWALVTGASSGIGREYAKQIAAHGLNVVLVARRGNLLESLANEIVRENGVQTRVLAVDLTTPDYMETVLAQTIDLDIGLLINNAGIVSPGGFLTRERDGFARVIDLNIKAPMELAHALGRRMITRGRGGMVFVSSIAAYLSVPYMANYTATKRYLLTLGEALDIELGPKGVDVQVLLPGPTRTEMMTAMDGADYSDVPMPWMETAPVVSASIRGLGKQTVVVPGGLNKMMRFMTDTLMPRRLMSTLMGGLMSRGMSSDIL